jgi:hypothetical protein
VKKIIINYYDAIHGFDQSGPRKKMRKRKKREKRGG